jgi:hypothetical protein
MSQGLKMSEKAMVKEVKYRLDRITNKSRAGSIFTASEEIAIEWILKELLGLDVSDIDRRLVEARKLQSICKEQTTEKNSPMKKQKNCYGHYLQYSTKHCSNCDVDVKSCREISLKSEQKAIQAENKKTTESKQI